MLKHALINSVGIVLLALFFSLLLVVIWKIIVPIKFIILIFIISFLFNIWQYRRKEN